MLFCPTAGSTVVQAEASVLGDYALGVIYFCIKTKTIINSICDKWIFLLDGSQILGLPTLNMGVWMICRTGVMFCTTCFFANMGDSIQTEQSETRQNLVLKSTKKTDLRGQKDYLAWQDFVHTCCSTILQFASFTVEWTHFHKLTPKCQRFNIGMSHTMNNHRIIYT